LHGLANRVERIPTDRIAEAVINDFAKRRPHERIGYFMYVSGELIVNHHKILLLWQSKNVPIKRLNKRSARLRKSRRRSVRAPTVLLDLLVS
jgi:hypothetical protein